MTSQTARANLMARDKTIVETAVPAHMLALMIEECGKLGLELRADVLAHLNRAAAAPLARLDAFSISRLAQRIDDVATALLRELNPDDPRHGLYCCVMFVMKLVDEGRFPDVRNQAVLVSMLLLEDVRDERKDVDGQGVVWRLQEAKWQEEAGKMLNRAAPDGPLRARGDAASCINQLNPTLPSYSLPAGWPERPESEANGHSLTASNWELPPDADLGKTSIGPAPMVPASKFRSKGVRNLSFPVRMKQRNLAGPVCPWLRSLFVLGFCMAELDADRMDRLDLEPRHGLFQDHGWLRFLLRRAFFRAFPGRRRTSV